MVLLFFFKKRQNDYKYKAALKSQRSTQFSFKVQSLMCFWLQSRIFFSFGEYSFYQITNRCYYVLELQRVPSKEMAGNLLCVFSINY